MTSISSSPVPRRAVSSRTIASTKENGPCGAGTDGEQYARLVADVLQSQPIQRRPVASIDLSPVTPLLALAANVAYDIIAVNTFTVRATNCRDEYLGVFSQALSDTYLRACVLTEQGHFDAIEEQIGYAVLERAEKKSHKPRAANDRGLALLDIHLRETAKFIKPLLAKQVDMLDELAK